MKNYLKSIFGRNVGLTAEEELLSRGGFVAGGQGRPAFIYAGPDRVSMFDDFLGDVLADEWTASFSDTGQAAGITQLTNGVYRMTSSATSTQTPNGGAQNISGALNWKANQGGLRFGTRLKIATLAGNSVFAGFTDTGGAEFPAYDTGGGLISPADDFVGFICSGEGGTTQQNWRFVAGKAGTDQTATMLGTFTPVANTYDELEFEVAKDGSWAKAWINGKPAAALSANVITPTVALAPTVMRANTDGASNVVDTDYIGASANRDTGT